jgi:hypothetical protein
MENSIWFGVVGDGASTSVTVNLSGSAISGATANICEYSGILTTGFLDKTSYNDGNGGTADTGTTDTTTQNEELWIGNITGMYGYSQGTPTNGFTLLDGFYELPISQGYLEKIVSSTGAANAGDSGIATYWGGCIATFKAATYGNYTLTVQAPSGSGTTNVTTGTHIYPSGTAVKVLASPSAGWGLHHWVLDTVVSGSSNPKTVIMTTNHTLQAVFTYTAWQGKVSGVSYADIAKIMGVPYSNIGSVGWQNARYSGAYISNAIWIMNAEWGGFPDDKKNALTDNLADTIECIAGSGIEYVFAFVGYWNPSTNNIGYTMTDSEMATMISAFHNIGVKVLAWAEDNTVTPMDIRASNRENIYDSIEACMAKADWDGYHDDIELYTGTLQEWIWYNNNCTTVLHNLGLLMTAAVPYDWEQNINQYLVMDYIVSMFYGGTSTLESSQAAAFWQEDFGEYAGHNTPPASPLIMGIMNYYGNTYPLAWQLGKVGEFHDLYGHPQLAGFSIWLYEYMGTSFDDWNQWSFWIDRIGGATPTLYEVDVSTSPSIPSIVSFNGTTHTVPYTYYTFGGPIVIDTQENVNEETHSVAFGDSDHNGGSLGYSSYTYASGPYNLTSPKSINSTYIYTPVAGNVKIAIYNATNYHISGWVGTDYHPYKLLNQSAATACTANSWNLVSIPSTSLPTGIYFIAIKINTNLMVGRSGVAPVPVGGETYGYHQYITQDYSTAFSTTYPQPEGQMGNEAAAYAPTAEIVYTPYTFSEWEDSSTNHIRTINIIGDMNVIAYYVP